MVSITEKAVGSLVRRQPVPPPRSEELPAAGKSVVFRSDGQARRRCYRAVPVRVRAPLPLEAVT